MKLKVTYDDCTESFHDSIEKAKTEILIFLIADRVQPKFIVEINKEGQEIQEYGCSWKVSIFPIEPEKEI